ncbi:hypothetical protein Vadar_004053 [Vaccinium darrowii]|uniref:Uncharacterized protein n=1 Tax=Vaccinium darrowii TaxID=229202 RepID=A0ACB7Z9E9_9ERIC|nr:hypothetical protein Vadar_004053 [Vaccinium darrowii]
MKMLSSSSSTSTSTAGCLPATLRRILCFNSLLTHPHTNQIKDISLNSAELDKLGCLETEEKTEEDTAAYPGIVARLMGLELPPRIGFPNTGTKPRSRSMDYDSSRESEVIQGQHRRAKTSLSYHEMPTFFEQDEFFVLSFENLGKNNEFRMKSRTLKRRKAGKCRRRECERRERVSGEEDKENQESNTRMTINHKISRTAGEAVEQLEFMNKEESDGGKQRKEEDAVEEEKGETECNSSPVSVLDFCESIFHPMEPISEEDESCKGSNSRRKLSTELENHEHSSPPCEPSSSTSDNPTRKMIHGKCYRSRGKGCPREINVKTWREICKIVEAEMIESNWVTRALWKVEDSRDIGAEWELQILQELLNEVVDQLVETSPEIF